MANGCTLTAYHSNSTVTITSCLLILLWATFHEQGQANRRSMSKRKSTVISPIGQTQIRAEIARMYERMMNVWRGFGGDDPLAPMNKGVPCPLWQDAAQAVLGRPFLPEKPKRQ